MTKGNAGPGGRALRRAPLVLGLVLIAAWFGRFAYLRITTHPTPRSEYWEQKLAALVSPAGTTLPSAANVNIPSPRSAGITTSSWMSPFGLIRGAWDEERDDVVAVSQVFKSPVFWQELDALRQSVAIGWNDDVSLDPWAPRTVSQAFVSWSGWIAVHARWLRESRSDLDGCLDNWLTGFRLARQIGRTPLVRNRLCQNLALGPMVRDMMCAAREPHDRIDTRGFAAEVLDILGPLKSAEDAFAGERLRLHCYLEHVFVREGGSWLDVAALARSPGLSRWGGTTGASRLWNLASPLFHDLETARRQVDVCFDRVSRRRFLVDFEDRGQATLSGPGLGILDGFPYLAEVQVMPSMRAGMLIERTRIEAALTLLAIYEYHCDTQSYPKELGELVPTYLPQLPIDYADGETLRYRSDGSTFVLLSVGMDGQEDGPRGPGPSPYQMAQDSIFSEQTR